MEAEQRHSPEPQLTDDFINFREKDSAENTRIPDQFHSLYISVDVFCVSKQIAFYIYSQADLYFKSIVCYHELFN